MNLTDNSTEYDNSDYHGNSTDVLVTSLNSTTFPSTTLQSTWLSFWSSPSKTLEETTKATHLSSTTQSPNIHNTASSSMKLTFLVSKPNSLPNSTTPLKDSSKPVTSSNALPVSKQPKWRRKMTLSNTTTTTHVTTTEPHITTQSLSTLRRTTLTTTTIVPSTEDTTVSPSTGSTPKTVTSVRFTENFSNVTYVTRDVIGGENEAGNPTVTPQTSSENPSKPSGYSQSIITPLVTPLMPLSVTGGSQKQSEKPSDTKITSNNRVGPHENPISHRKPRHHPDVHINEALLNNTAVDSNHHKDTGSHKNDEPQMSDAPAPPIDINAILRDMEKYDNDRHNDNDDAPFAEPLIHRLNVPVLVSTSSTTASSTTASSASSTTASSTTASSTTASSTTASSTTASSTTEHISSTTSAASSSLSSASSSSTPSSTLAPLLPISVSNRSSSESTLNPTTNSTESASSVPSTESTTKLPTSPSRQSTSESLSSSTSSTSSHSASYATSTSQLTSSTIASTSGKTIGELWLSFTNRPVTIETSTETTRSTTNTPTTPTTTLTVTSNSIIALRSSVKQSTSTSQTSKSSLESTLPSVSSTYPMTPEHSVAPNQQSEVTKSSDGYTVSIKSPIVRNYTQPPFADFLGPRPSNDPPKEEHPRNVDMVRNMTALKGQPTDPTVPSILTTLTTGSSNKKPLGVAKPTVYSNTTTPANVTLDKMVVGPVSKPSYTNMAAIVVPVLLVMVLAGVGAFFFVRKRSRCSRNNHKSRKESDVTTPLHVDLEPCSRTVEDGPVYARVDFSKKKTKGISNGDYTAVQFHERPVSEETVLLSHAAESHSNRRDWGNTSEESLAPIDLPAPYFVENDLKIDDERSLESIGGLTDDDFDYMDSGDCSQGSAYAAKEELRDRDSGALSEQTGDSPLRLPTLAPPIPVYMPSSDDGLTSDSDFEELQSPDISGSLLSSVLEDYSEPTPPQITSRPHFYDQVYISRSAINNFVDSTNYVKGRKRSDSVHTNPYEEIGPAGGATGRGPVPSTSGVGRGMAIYATVDETRMDGRAYGTHRYGRYASAVSPPDMSPEELSTYNGNQGASASPTLGPLLPTKRTNTSFRGPPLLLSRRRSRRRRTWSLPPRSRRDYPRSLPEKPDTPCRPRKSTTSAPDEQLANGMIPDYVTSLSLDLLDSGCWDIDLDVPVPSSDDIINPCRLLLPPALPERTQLPPKQKPIPIRDRPLPQPEPKKERPIPDRTSTTARTTNLDLVSYDVDLDSLVPPSKDNLEESFAPLMWLPNPEPRYSGLLRSGDDREDSAHQYTSLDAMPGTSGIRRDKNRPERPNSLSSKSEGHLDRTSGSSIVGQYLDINIAAFTSNNVLPSSGGYSDQSENRSAEYDSVYSPPKDPIYESVDNPSYESEA